MNEGVLKATEFLEQKELNNDDTFKYQMLGRMQGDCDFYLGDASQSHNPKYLWANTEQEQIDIMKNLYLSFPDDKKPQWISMNDIKDYESKMVKSRVEELANKIGLKENAYCLKKMPEWIENSKLYADKMIKGNMLNTNNLKEIRLIYLLNKLCPNLHHFKQKPFGTESLEIYNKMMNEYSMENSQAEFSNKEGKVIQNGVIKSEKEFNKFMAVIDKYIEKAKPEIQQNTNMLIDENTRPELNENVEENNMELKELLQNANNLNIDVKIDKECVWFITKEPNGVCKQFIPKSSDESKIFLKDMDQFLKKIPPNLNDPAALKQYAKMVELKNYLEGCLKKEIQSVTKKDLFKNNDLKLRINIAKDKVEGNSKEVSQVPVSDKQR